MTSSNKHGANQFEILSFIENGNGSKIYDVVQRQRNRKYTMEVVPRKSSIQDDSKNTRLHKHSQLKTPSCFLTQLKYSFQTKTRKYFILSHLHIERNLQKLLQTQKVFNSKTAKFIIIQMIAALDQLHKANVCYGSLHIRDVYFDNKGFVILKRTYNAQTYWMKNECYGCHKGKCKNKYHTEDDISEQDIAEDYNNLGQVFVHLITGSQHSYSILESLDKMTRDFAYLLLRHDVTADRIKNNSFISEYNWDSVLNKDLDVPDKIQAFVNEMRLSQSSENGIQLERENNNGSPSEILVGVRKSRSKSEDPGRAGGDIGEKQKERSKSYNDSRITNGYADNDSIENRIHQSKSLTESTSSVFGDNTDSNAPPKSRRKSIDIYQKRLQEISKVLDKNRVIVHGKEALPSKPTTPDQLVSNNNNINTSANQQPNIIESVYFEKMYSENDALRTILTKYGLLKSQSPSSAVKQEKEETVDSPNEDSNNLLSSKRKQRKNRKNNLMSQSCNNIQIHFDNSEEGDEAADKHTMKSSLGKKQRSETCLNTLVEPTTREEKGSNHLIDKLNSVSKSKTFYMKRSQSTNSLPRQMKRHFSDSTIKPSLHSVSLATPSVAANEKQMSAPQALASLLKTSSMMTQHKQTSCDSGLNEDLNEDVNEERRLKKRQPLERNDSGLGSSHEKEVIRVWRPERPDSTFLEQEDKKVRATETECFDCGAVQFEEPFPNSIDRLCKQCGKSRIERKEAVVELIETEVNFGEDLQILKEEFYTPLKTNNICTTDEISKLFLNLQELVDVNAKLCASLQHGLHACLNHDDFDYINLAVGDVFLDNVEFFEAYELYCAKQNESTDLLKSLIKKSDLLRVFLQVSTRENVKLRKMDLKSFLTMPVQRIMKYPLLLSRIYKHTPKKNADRKTLKEAMHKVEEQISRINDLSKKLNVPKVKKSLSFKTLMDIDSTNSEDLTKMIASLKEWKLEETSIIAQEDFEIIETDLVNLTSWSKYSFKKISYQQAIIAVNHAPEHYLDLLKDRLRNEKTPYTLGEIKDAVIVFLKQKSIDKCLVQKTTIRLKDCIIARNLNIPVAFELTEMEKVPLTFVARNASTCKAWRKTIQFVIDSCKIKWRQRRAGRPNIMTEKLHLED